MRSCDVVVLGGGPNGLTAAALLAATGRRVVLLEAEAELGGGGRFVEVAPGYRAPALADRLDRLHPDVIRRLDLAGHGFAPAARAVPTTVLAEGLPPLTLAGAFGATVEGEIDAGERAAFAALRARLLALAGVVEPALAAPPPRIDRPGRGDLLILGGLALRLRRLGRDAMGEALRTGLMSVQDLLDETLRDDRLRGYLAFEAGLGTRLGPRAPTSVAALVRRLTGRAGGAAGAVDLPADGARGLVAALAAAARAAGADLRTGAPVERILVERHRAAGVRLAGGGEIRAGLVLSTIHPATTLLDLVGPAHLDVGVTRAVRGIRSRGTVARVLVALDGPPRAPGLDAPRLAGRLLVCDGAEAVEAALDRAKYEEVPERPILEAVIPSLSDPALAPPGGHVLSVTAIHAPTRPADPGAARAAFTAAVLSRLETALPDLSRRIVAVRCLLPVDIERAFRMPGGHWHHGELSLDQAGLLRPVPEAARHRAPLDGLYLGGAGSHPGGGISGAPALAAVRAILEDSR